MHLNCNLYTQDSENNTEREVEGLLKPEDYYIYSGIVWSRYDKGAIPMKSQQYCNLNKARIMAKEDELWQFSTSRWRSTSRKKRKIPSSPVRTPVTGCAIPRGSAWNNTYACNTK